jgi:hypothetical protein
MTELITKLQKYESPLWGYHFPISADIASKYIDGNNRRILCQINGQHSMQCALMPSKDGFFILINKNLVSKLNLMEGADVKLKIAKDHSEFGHEVPESFQVLLDQDVDGRGYFDQLTPGKQRSLIYIVGKVKNPDGQLNKGMAILDHLKMVKGKLDFKKLNALIKEYNQRSKLK